MLSNYLRIKMKFHLQKKKTYFEYPATLVSAKGLENSKMMFWNVDVSRMQTRMNHGHTWYLLRAACGKIANPNWTFFRGNYSDIWLYDKEVVHFLNKKGACLYFSRIFHLRKHAKTFEIKWWEK